MNIQAVDSHRDLLTFLEFQYKIYNNDPVWIPPLRNEQLKQFDPKTNPFLRHCERQLFLLKDKGKVTMLEAKLKAEQEYDKYRVIQDKDYESDFDREIKKLENKKK